MQRSIITAMILLVFIVAGVWSIKYFIGPNNYEDCILAYIKPSMTPVAVSRVTASCRAKFPNKEENGPGFFTWTKDLSDDQIANITGRAGLSNGNRYSGNLYNGNVGMTLTQVTISVWTSAVASKIYTIDVNIPPLTTKDFGVDIVAGDPGDTYRWRVLVARGY